MSSSWTNPCAHHNTAVFACAFAMYGLANAPAAANPTERLINERRVNPAMAFPSLRTPGDCPGASCFGATILDRALPARVNDGRRPKGRNLNLGVEEWTVSLG